MKAIESSRFRRWRRAVRGTGILQRVNARIRVILDAERIVGDYKHVGEGVFELRFATGPGYRVYVSPEAGDRILLLLVGGDKSSQSRDIKLARQIAQAWRNEHE